MLIILLAILVFGAVTALIAVGVILGKRTPLRGSCASAGHEPHGPGRTCGTCTCGAGPVAPPGTGFREDREIGCGPVEEAPPPSTGRSAK